MGRACRAAPAALLAILALAAARNGTLAFGSPPHEMA